MIYEENLKSEVEDQKAQNSDNNPLLYSHDSPVSKRSMDDDPALVRKAKNLEQILMLTLNLPRMSLIILFSTL